MIQMQTVAMSAVPVAPRYSRNTGSKWDEIYLAAKKLGFDEKSAVMVFVADRKQYDALRFRLALKAKQDGLFLCTSRNVAFTEIYVWLVKPLKAAK